MSTAISCCILIHWSLKYNLFKVINYDTFFMSNESLLCLVVVHLVLSLTLYCHYAFFNNYACFIPDRILMWLICRSYIYIPGESPETSTRIISKMSCVIDVLFLQNRSIDRDSEM